MSYQLPLEFVIRQGQVHRHHGDALARWSALLERTAGKELMNLELARPMERQNNVLVLV